MKGSKAVTKFILLFVLIVLFSASVYGQTKSERNTAPPLRERIIFGGNFSLQFGTYAYVDLTPTVGLWVLPRISIAAGPSYKYLKDPFGSTDAYGGKAYTRFVLIQDLDKLIPIGFRMSLYVHGEYERMSYRSDYFYTAYENERFMQDFVLAGLGISQYLGIKSSVNISILWVINESEIQIYDSPEIRIGFTF